ncbi:MAG TPA: VWA domain-containing protein [Pyrinomonadaceae bacterium]|nr:VWA domain-containing protein [Pyrinomonadaceae bacterium]
MKKLAAVIVGLLMLASVAVAVAAQSGRNRSVPTADRGGDAAKQSSDESKDEGEPSSGGEPELVEGEVVRVDTSLVTIPVSVRDRQGRYAPDLRREDFRVFEDGVEQRVAYFATVDQPFTVALVLDTSGSTEFSIGDMQRAASAFVEQLKPADRVTVISFDDRIDVLCQPTSDRAELNRAIRRARGGGGTRLYDAVESVLRKTLAPIPGRKAVVLLTDGVDTTSRHASYNSSLRLAEESDALVYPVSYGGFRGNPGVLGQPPQTGIKLPGGIILGNPRTTGGMGGTTAGDYERGDAYLNQLAMRTGGRMYRGNSFVNISQAFAWVAEELRRQYSLGYYPKSAGKNGERRQIKVQVAQPDLVVQSRDSYVYRKADEKEAGGEPAAKPGSPPQRLNGTR